MLEHREIGFVPLVLFSFRFIPFLRRMRIYELSIVSSHQFHNCFRFNYKLFSLLSFNSQCIYIFQSPASLIDVADWLQHLDLDHESCYMERLRAEGIITIRDVKSREWSDELLDSLEIMIPGHRKRVKSAGRNFELAHS